MPRSLSDFLREMRCQKKIDGCKARIAGNGYSIAKICNTANAIFAGNPPGRGDFYVLLRRSLLVWNDQTAPRCFLHYKKIILVALTKEVRQAPGKLAKLAVMAALSLNAVAALAAAEITVYKSTTCGCCEKYVDYLRENGFAVKAVNESNMDAIKKRYGVSHAASCHTALIGGYVIEGHVPVTAIRKLLKEKPNLIGISAPGMPMNSPGMGEMKKGTLTIYAVPKGKMEPYVFSVE